MQFNRSQEKFSKWPILQFSPPELMTEMQIPRWHSSREMLGSRRESRCRRGASGWSAATLEDLGNTACCTWRPSGRHTDAPLCTIKQKHNSTKTCSLAHNIGHTKTQVAGSYDRAGTVAQSHSGTSPSSTRRRKTSQPGCWIWSPREPYSQLVHVQIKQKTWREWKRQGSKAMGCTCSRKEKTCLLKRETSSCTLPSCFGLWLTAASAQ